MQRKRATTKATGGGGFTFADRVAAGFLAEMLKRAFPLEPDLGPIVELHFEVRDTGQVLDDLLLSLKHGNDITRCAVSVKSNRQLAKSGFNAEFVEDAWEQWRGTGGSHFNPATDLLGLIVGALDDPTFQEWREFQKQAASTTPDRLVQRLSNEGQSSTTQRDIFESLRVEVNGVSPDPLETARLASRLRVLYFSDEAEGQYVNLCEEIVRDGSQDEAADLWSRLLQLAAENRATGGYFDLPKLVRQLRGDFELKDYPDFEADWIRLESVTTQNVKSVRSVVGSDIQLERKDEVAKLETDVGKQSITIVVGESGSGKSALVAQIIASNRIFKRRLWLTAGQWSKASQAELAHAFSLQHDIAELIAHSTVQNCVLVLDGFEQFEGDARRRAVELLKALKEVELVGWSVIITCQPSTRDSTRDFLVEAGLLLDVTSRVVELEKPALQDIVAAVRHLPGMGALLLRNDLQPILRNLVVLDWVLRADVAQRFATPDRQWIGETELIDCIWERWTGTTAMRLARDALLRNLGQREGERLSGAVHVDAIPPDQLALLSSLADEGLIAISGSSVRFSHDLMGDWARFRSLVFSGQDVAKKITDVAPVPRWGRAIGLYAQSLAEKGQGLDQWKSVAAQLAGDESTVQLASDLFLDGLLFAANSGTLLDLVWPDLIGDKGQILNRLLKRLLHVASMPDWRFRYLVEPKFAEQSEVWFRIPHPLYWYPALCVFARHSVDVATHALLQGAEVCALWLRTMPEGMPGRREAGSLALELAKETQGKMAEGLHFGEHDRVVYEALLYAAREFPEEVSQIALELCTRLKEPDHALKRREAFRQEEARRYAEWAKQHPEQIAKRRNLPPPIRSLSEGPIRPAFPEGPLRRVPEGFRSAVLDTPALEGLIGARPVAAKEVVLAVCLDEPKPWNPYRERYLLADSLGLAHWQRSYPPMYWKGPFGRFLQNAPQQGLEAVVLLVNHATARWLEVAAGPEPSAEELNGYGWEFESEGKTACWIGNCTVYGWHRQIPSAGDMVACALMALENWLYNEIDNGRSIAPWVQYMFAHGESLAFAGVLVSVGLKYPGLFTKELQPLLGNFDLYWCQQNWGIGERQGFDVGSWNTQGPQAMKLAQNWNCMPHRSHILWDVATSLMLQDDGTMKYLAECQAEWAKRLEGSSGKGRERIEFFLARFDPNNYTQTPMPDGQVCITMRWPAHLEAIANQSQEEQELKTLSLSLAISARQCLSGAATLEPEQVSNLATQVQHLARWTPQVPEPHQEQYRVNSIAGGLAVLVVQYRGWLWQNPAIERWCMETLRQIKPPKGSEFDSPSSLLDHTAESFLGEAGIALLLESSEEWVTRLALEGVTGFYYGSTLQVMWRAYLLRDQLGGKFDELVNIVVLWSALRRGATRESGYQANRDLLVKYKKALFRRYAAGKLKGQMIPLRRAELLGSRLLERISRRLESSEERRSKAAHRQWVREREDRRKVYREHPDIDTEVLQKGFGFLFAMVRASLPAEVQKVREYVRELFDLEMRTFPAPVDKDDNYEFEGTPYHFDDWIMRLVAKLNAHANSRADARTLYVPILELGPAARYWVEDFLQAWIIVGLETTANTAEFVKIWRDMVEYTVTLSAWEPGDGNYWCRAESLAVDLMGLHKDAAAVLGQAKHAQVVSAMIPVFEQWANRWLKFGTIAAWFADFLATESGAVLLPLGIKKLSSVVGSLRDGDWQRGDLGGLLTAVLSACWQKRQRDVASDSELRQAFLRILTELCARQIPEALHLRIKVAESLSGTST